MRKLGILIGMVLVCAAWGKTEVKKEGNSWKLYVDQKPFEIKGVTFGGDYTKENIGSKLRDLKFLGVNTIRLWGVGDKTKLLLDSAHAYGIKVMVGIWMRHGRPGMEADDSFNYLVDTAGMRDMHKGAIEAVEVYKKHPAVLFWGVGNEVFLNIATDKEKKVYAKFLEKVCSDIKQRDKEHPIASVEAWTFGLKWWKEYCPSVDIYGINSYGAGAAMLEDEIKKSGADKPYVITEFGVSGEWDAKKDKNGISIEPTDEDKYYAIATGYKEWIKSKSSCLGVYVFHYENGENFGSVWLLMQVKGCFRPAYWATREAFTGKKPENVVPSIKTFSLPDSIKKPNDWVTVALEVQNPESENLEYSFYYNQRSGSRARRDQLVSLAHRGDSKNGFQIQMPKENGGLKIYAMVKDAARNIGIATTSISVDGPKDGFLPGAKVNLPFAVYQDNVNVSYIPSAYMGDTKSLKLDMSCKDQVHSGEHSISISYVQMDGWFGIGFVDPVNDWGDRPGGFNVSGAQKFTFWAKASSTKVNAKLGFGLIGTDKPFPDTHRQSVQFDFTTEWKKYEIKLPANADLRCIRSGLVIFGQGVQEPYTLWIDDVQFE